MIISRTPFRISFFGGGTDYPVWFEENGGAVLATTFDKYSYISCRQLPPFFDHKHRIAYSSIERVNSLEEINHPSVRETLRFMRIEGGLEIHHDADLPARTGLGSSSSFTVGLLNALYALNGRMPSKEELAKTAIYIEQDLIKENVGSQDQTLAAYGGFNYVEFKPNREIVVKPVTLTMERSQLFNDHLMLFFTGFSRTASEIAKTQIKNTRQKTAQLKRMKQMVEEGLAILCSDHDLNDFGELLHEGWQLKRSLSDKISNQAIDNLYEVARSAGAVGGKLLGAGGGGFLLIFAHPKEQPAIREKLKNLLYVPFKLESTGSQIIFYSPTDSFNGNEVRI